MWGSDLSQGAEYAEWGRVCGGVFLIQPTRVPDHIGVLNVVRGPSWLGNGHHFPDPTPKPRPQTHFLHILGHRMLLRERKCDFFAKRKCLGLRILPLSVSGCKWLKNTCCETNDYQLSPAAWSNNNFLSLSSPGGNCRKCLLATPLLLSTCIKIHQ